MRRRAAAASPSTPSSPMPTSVEPGRHGKERLHARSHPRRLRARPRHWRRLPSRTLRTSTRRFRSPGARATPRRCPSRRAVAASAASKGSSPIWSASGSRPWSTPRIPSPRRCRAACQGGLRETRPADRQPQPRALEPARGRSLDRGRGCGRGRDGARPDGAPRLPHARPPVAARLSRRRRSIITSSSAIDGPQGLDHLLPHHRLILARRAFRGRG